MSSSLRLATAQLDLEVGDVTGNTERIIEAALRARDSLAADIVVFPELSVSGYPPEDLLLHKGLKIGVSEALTRIKAQARGIHVVVGHPEYAEDGLFNSCSVIADGAVVCSYRKQRLPNYAVFDEKRYFSEGSEPSVFKLRDVTIGLTICEDIWHPEPIAACRDAGADIVLSINGSPYEQDSQSSRERAAAERAAESSLPLVYVNTVGGQDELVFDGGSFAMGAAGDIRYRAAAFEETLGLIEFEKDSRGVSPIPSTVSPLLDKEASVYTVSYTHLTLPTNA